MDSKSPGSVLKVAVVEGADCSGLAIDGGLQAPMVVNLNRHDDVEKKVVPSPLVLLISKAIAAGCRYLW